jgi:hypothetical protein
MTAISEAMTKAGFDQFDFQARAFIRSWFRSGGSYERLEALIVDEMQMLGIGQKDPAEAGHNGAADPELPGQIMVADQGQGASAGQDEGAEATSGMSQDQVTPASAPSAGDTVGHPMRASFGGRSQPARRVVEQSASRRARAARNAAKAATSIMDTMLINGRSLGDYSVGQAQRLGLTRTREGYILLAASRHAANAPGNALIRDVVSVKAMQEIVQRAAEYADAA